MQSVKMGEMTVEEVRAYLESNKTVILPYGVVEQHGYHLPLDTDIRNAEIMGLKIAEKLGCIVAPTLNYCFSGGLLPGTINIKPNTFCLMMGEIVESLARQGFENIIVLPGHGGSESLLILKESLRILKWLNPSLSEVMILLARMGIASPSWHQKIKEKDYHAGEVETSLIKYWTPEVVREKIVMDDDATAEAMRRSPDFYQLLTVLSGHPNEIPNTRQKDEIKVGVMGYPDRSNVSLGKKITEEILENMVPALRKAIAEADISRKNKIFRTLASEEKIKVLSI